MGHLNAPIDHEDRVRALRVKKGRLDDLIIKERLLGKPLANFEV